jgi:ribosomal protein S6
MAEMSHPEAQAEGSSQANTPVDPRPVYEVGFHVVPTASEDEVSRTVEKIKAEITKGNAEIINEQFPTKMALAYTVEQSSSGKREKFSEAYFGFIKFATERENIPQLEKLLQSTKEVLRFLLIETVRDEVVVRRAVFTSDRLEGETIKKPTSAPEEKGPVSEEELEKSIEALTQ